MKERFSSLEQNKRYYLNILETHSESQLFFSRSKDEWNVSQVIHHIIKVERQTLQFMNDFDFTRKDEVLGLKATFNNFLLKFALKSPLKFRVPNKAVIPDDDINKEFLLLEWNNLRNKFADFLKYFPHEKMDNFIFIHPRSGKLNINQTLEFLLAHMNHHKQQVKRIYNCMDFPTSTEI